MVSDQESVHRERLGTYSVFPPVCYSMSGFFFNDYSTNCVYFRMCLISQNSYYLVHNFYLSSLNKLSVRERQEQFPACSSLLLSYIFLTVSDWHGLSCMC